MKWLTKRSHPDDIEPLHLRRPRLKKPLTIKGRTTSYAEEGTTRLNDPAIPPLTRGKKTSNRTNSGREKRANFQRINRGKGSSRKQVTTSKRTPRKFFPEKGHLVLKIEKKDKLQKNKTARGLTSRRNHENPGPSANLMTLNCQREQASLNPSCLGAGNKQREKEIGRKSGRHSLSRGWEEQRREKIAGSQRDLKKKMYPSSLVHHRTRKREKGSKNASVRGQVKEVPQKYLSPDTRTRRRRI